MELALTSRERDQAVYAIRDLQGILQYTKKPEYAELDEIQALLATRGLQIAAIPKTPGLTSAVTLPAATSGAQFTTPLTLSTQEKYWIEVAVIAPYQAFKRENRKGYVYTNELMGRLLDIVCKPLGIAFKS